MNRAPARRLQVPIEVPADAADVEVTGPRPFLTRVRYVRADGSVFEWSARPHRKTQPSTRGLTWRIGLLFAIGSACFLVGPIPAYADRVGGRATATTFFAGSLVFTAAAWLSLVQVVRQDGHRWIGWSPHLMGFWAAVIQLVGTLAFNVSTFGAYLDLDAAQADRFIWRPDVIGSVCFLVSSAIAFGEAGHRWFSWRPGRRAWQITALNWWGSVLFGISAAGAYILPDDSTYNARWANGGTFLGAACFLVASLMMMREGVVDQSDASG